MSSELPKTYEPAAVEAEANRVWMEEKCFAADPAASGDPYTIVIPPPNVTGALHLGHAINNTLQDILTRVHRMRGFNTLWIPGIDHAGIATQAVVEKQLKEKENKTRHDIGRDELVRRIWEWKQQFGDRIIEQLKRLGCSCDWDRTRFTLDDMCARAVRETFFKLFKDGLIYRGKRLVNWDVHLQTSISDDEIYHETVKTSLWHIKYPIDGTDKFMVVATTRPETMLGDTAVAVHSEDSRWNWAIGKNVKLPLTDRLIPIIADDILVDPKFGSGVVKVTPAHDPNDYAVWQRHQGKTDQIDLINILNPDGRLNDNGGGYAGMKRDAARKKVVEDLTALGLLEKEEPYETQVGHSDRSKTPVEPYLSDQWYVKMAPLAEPALEVVRNGTIKFYPERHAQQYLAWLGEKRDWPISRQLWWGHRIPVWHKRITITPENRVSLVMSGDLEFLDAGNPIFGWYSGDNFTNDKPIASASFHHVVSGQTFNFINDAKGPPNAGMPWITAAICGEFDVFVCVADAPNMEKRLVSLGYIQDPDVLDTWFSSALWPHSTLGWPEQTPELKKYYPTSVLLTGRDIITLWVARMVMTGMYNMGQRTSSLSASPGTPDVGWASPTSSPSGGHCPPYEERRAIGAKLGVPFLDVAINPTILDGKGERMSKSKGNGVDPVEIIDIQGADALRFTLTLMATETQDARLPVKKDAQGRNTSEKFDIGRNFANKLWNAARFTLDNLDRAPKDEKVDESKWTTVERWIVSRFSSAVEDANTALAQYRFDQYAQVCYDFFWRDFCDWYVEAIKPALKDPAKAAQTANVLAFILDGTLRLLHPMIPFITETIWWRLNDVRPQRSLSGHIECPPSKRLIKAEWPKALTTDPKARQEFAQIQEIVGAIRNARTEHKANPRQLLKIHIDPFTDNIRRNGSLVNLLAACELHEAQNINVLRNAKNIPRISVAGYELWLADLFNEDIEKDRVEKRVEELNKKIATLRGRLENPGYIARAPQKLVDETKAQLKDAEDELKKRRDNQDQKRGNS